MVETRWRYGMLALMAASFGLFGCSDLAEADDTDGNSDDEVVVPPKPGPTSKFSCTYPVGGISGVAQGNTVPSFIQLENGFMPGSDVPTTFPFAETFDCDGSSDYHVIAIDTSQYG